MGAIDRGENKGAELKTITYLKLKIIQNCTLPNLSLKYAIFFTLYGKKA
jgi:hypothetical protein